MLKLYLIASPAPLARFFGLLAGNLQKCMAVHEESAEEVVTMNRIRPSDMFADMFCVQHKVVSGATIY